MDSYIKAISYYLPKKVLTNEQLSNEFPEWTGEKILSKVGVSERHIADNNETASDMAVSAANILFSEHSIDKSEIDFILFCSQSVDYFLPSSACIIQSRLGIPTSCGAFDFNLGCSGFVYGLSIASGLIAAGIAKNILLLTAETYTKHIHPLDKGNRTIFGDAAAATLISVSGFAKVGKFMLGTDGRGADNLIVKSGCMRMRHQVHDLQFDDSNNPISSDYLYMNGKEIFDFTADTVPKLIGDVLKQNNLKDSDISLYIFHQANRFMINYLRKILGINNERFYECMKLFGNTVSSTIPIALCEAKKDGVLKGNVILAGFGVGYSWGATALSCC
jgi:3-oxoacyl-[acyl-carrier-protein] synthase-3